MFVDPKEALNVHCVVLRSFVICFRGQAARHEGAGGRDDTAAVLGQHRHLWRPAQYQVVPRVLQDIRVQRDGGHRAGGRRLQRQVSSVSATVQTDTE